MSIVIQKRRVHPKVLNLDAKQPSIYEPNTFRYRQYLSTFKNLEDNFSKNFLEGNLKAMKTLLASFHKSFKKNELLLTDLSKQKEATEQEFDNIFLIQRVKSLVKLLADYFVNKRNIILQNQSAHELSETLTTENQEVNIITIKILKAFSMVNPIFGKLLAHCPVFIETLLNCTLQSYKLYFKQTLRILEALLRFNPDTITQDMYPIISEILSNLPKKHFARFSRIIALFLLENTEKIDFKELHSSYSESKTNKVHSILLSTPAYLESYVVILESLKQTIIRLTSVNQDNLTKTLTDLKESKLIKNSAVDLRVLKPVFEQCKTARNLIKEVFASEFIIRFVVSKSNLTEIFFLLSSLLAGRRKVDVQEKLNQLDFFNRVLEPFFGILFHPDIQLEDPQDPSNANNSLSTARIQLIRTMLNFCDKNEPNANCRDLFITSEEKMLFDKEVMVEKMSPLDIIKTSKYLSSQKGIKQNIFENISNKGLLLRIIDLLKKASPNSSYYSWFSLFIDTFLRGSDQYYQILVAHTGLLTYLLEKITQNQIVIASNIQVTYDLIAEIFRFNPYNMIFLEKICLQFDSKAALVNGIEQNIVNSNVFLRSAVLSWEKLCWETSPDQQVYEKYDFDLFKDLYQKKGQLLGSLIVCVTPQTININNLCCVNTALAIAILVEQQENTLEEYFPNLVGDRGFDKESSQESLKEFQKLLTIWGQYYLSNTQARFNLEVITGIKFIYFQDIIKRIQNL